MESCKLFIARAQRRVTRAEEVKRAQEQREVYVAEVEEAQQRLLSLQEDAAHPPTVMVPEVGELQKQIEELVRERDLLRQGFRTRVPKDGQGEWFADNIPDLTAVPPHACRSTRFGGLDQQSELRDAQRLEFGDAPSIARLACC